MSTSERPQASSQDAHETSVSQPSASHQVESDQNVGAAKPSGEASEQTAEQIATEEAAADSNPGLAQTQLMQDATDAHVPSITSEAEQVGIAGEAGESVNQADAALQSETAADASHDQVMNGATDEEDGHLPSAISKAEQAGIAREAGESVDQADAALPSEAAADASHDQVKHGASDEKEASGNEGSEEQPQSRQEAVADRAAAAAEADLADLDPSKPADDDTLPLSTFESELAALNDEGDEAEGEAAGQEAAAASTASVQEEPQSEHQAPTATQQGSLSADGGTGHGKEVSSADAAVGHQKDLSASSQDATASSQPDAEATEVAAAASKAEGAPESAARQDAERLEEQEPAEESRGRDQEASSDHDSHAHAEGTETTSEQGSSKSQVTARYYQLHPMIVNYQSSCMSCLFKFIKVSDAQNNQSMLTDGHQAEMTSHLGVDMAQQFLQAMAPGFRGLKSP